MAPEAPAAPLSRFDSGPFTLHAHCGSFSGELRRCLKKHRATEDPVAQHDENWRHAPACQQPWEEYRRCGRELLKSIDASVGKCKEQSDAFRACTEDSSKPGSVDATSSRCEELEMAALRCAGRAIRKRMTGKGLSQHLDAEPPLK